MRYIRPNRQTLESDQVPTQLSSSGLRDTPIPTDLVESPFNRLPSTLYSNKRISVHRKPVTKVQKRYLSSWLNPISKTDREDNYGLWPDVRFEPSTKSLSPEASSVTSRYSRQDRVVLSIHHSLRDSREIRHPCLITKYMRIPNSLGFTPCRHKATLRSSMFPSLLFQYYRLCLLGFGHPSTDLRCGFERLFKAGHYANCQISYKAYIHTRLWTCGLIKYLSVVNCKWSWRSFSFVRLKLKTMSTNLGYWD